MYIYILKAYIEILKRDMQNYVEFLHDLALLGVVVKRFTTRRVVVQYLYSIDSLPTGARSSSYTVRYGTVWYCTGKGSVPYLVADYFGRFGPLERKTVKENPAP